MTSDSDGASDFATRRKFLVASGAVGLAGVAGCSGNSGSGESDSADQSSGGQATGTEAAGGETQTAESGSSAPKRLSAEGSSTVYPIANTAASYWNSNPPASDQEYWPTEKYGYDTERNLADYWASLYGFEPTGKQAQAPFHVTVGLSHSGTGIHSVMNDLVDIGDASASAEAELDDPSQETLDQFVNHVVGRDGQPICVSKEVYDAGVTKLTADEVRGIYTGEIENWSEIDAYEGEDKEIYAVGRAEGSGTDTSFRINMLGDANADMPGVDTRKGQNQQAQKTVAQADNAIVYIALAFVSEEVPAVALEFDGTTYELGDDEHGLGSADYPLNRDLHMYTWQDTDKRESAFINFILSDMGQDLFVAANNYFKLPNSAREAERKKLADQV